MGNRVSIKHCPSCNQTHTLWVEHDGYFESSDILEYSCSKTGVKTAAPLHMVPTDMAVEKNADDIEAKLIQRPSA
jgi:hypothetical protein